MAQEREQRDAEERTRRKIFMAEVARDLLGRGA